MSDTSENGAASREDGSASRDDGSATSRTSATRPAPRVLLDYLTLAHEHLAAKGVDSPRLDAELLLCRVLGLSRVELYTNHDRPMAKEEIDRFRELLRRRAMREPLAYIVGCREFWSLELEVDRRVLIPRPETETLVEVALDLLRPRAAADGSGAAAPVADGRALRVLDIGTGSGAIAVALAKEIPSLRVVATDLTAAALEVAPRNAARHGLSDRIELRQGDLFAPLARDERFDLIASNPPYVCAGELASLEPEVRQWEPLAALISGEDGMDVTARIIERAPDYLAADGHLLLEVGTQAERVKALLEAGKWREIKCRADLAGRPRVVSARTPAV